MGIGHQLYYCWSFLSQKSLQMRLVLRLSNTHLTKRLSDLKQNGTHEKTSFSGTVFNTLLHGVVRFVAKKYLLTFFDSQSEASIQWFLNLPFGTKWNISCERVLKNNFKRMIDLTSPQAFLKAQNVRYVT